MLGLGRLFGKAAEIADVPRQQLLEIVQHHNPYAVDLRKWCVYKGVVGICAAIQGNMAEFHRTNAIGETVEILLVPYAELRLATYMEIPESRRNISAVRAAIRGYI
jgi:hypothetical protein